MLSFPVNSLLSSNISILIGPMETSAVIATHPLCSRASVPQIAPLTSLEIISEGDSGLNYLLRMSPTEKLKAKAIAEIIKRYKWETMAVLGYQNKEGEVSNKFYVQIQFCTNLSVIKCGLQRSNTLRIEPWDNLPCAANRVFLQSDVRICWVLENIAPCSDKYQCKRQKYQKSVLRSELYSNKSHSFRSRWNKFQFIETMLSRNRKERISLLIFFVES